MKENHHTAREWEHDFPQKFRKSVYRDDIEELMTFIRTLLKDAITEERAKSTEGIEKLKPILYSDDATTHIRNIATYEAIIKCLEVVNQERK